MYASCIQCVNAILVFLCICQINDLRDGAAAIFVKYLREISAKC